MLWKTLRVPKYQHQFDLNWQAAGSSHAVLLTKVFTGGPHPSHSSICVFLYNPVFIYIFLFYHHQHSTQQLLRMTHKKEESRSKEGLKTAGNPEILKVVSGLLSCFSSIVRNCNQTSGGKIKSLFCYQNIEN